MTATSDSEMHKTILFLYIESKLNEGCLWTHLSKQGTQEEAQGSQWVSRNLQHHKCRTWAQAERTWGQSYTGSHRPWTDLQSPSPCIAGNLPLGQQEEGRTQLKKMYLIKSLYIKRIKKHILYELNIFKYGLLAIIMFWLRIFVWQWT